MTRSLRHSRRRRTRTLAVLAVGSLLLATLPVGAQAITRPDTLLDLRPVTAGEVAVGFPVDHLGVRFQLPAGFDAHDVEDLVQVRFRHDGRWGDWTALGEDGAQQPGWWTSALVAAGDADAYQVRGVPAAAHHVRAAAINTTDGPPVVVGHRRPGAAEASTPCRSRADWGVDEGLRSASRTYAPLQLLTVHHTATDTAAATADPDATVRAIYSWHTTGNGWDDIGYQVLVAPDGTLYEGRWSGSTSRSCLTEGGDGTDFGHATTATDADIVTGAHAGGHNTGNYGVALLGTYVDAAPSDAARAALVDHLAEVAGRHGLDPSSDVAYDNGVNRGTFPAVAGHRDINATACPGGVLYADLPAIRQDVATALGGQPPTPAPPPDGTLPTVAVHGEQAVTGVVAGAWSDTTTLDGRSQQVTEVESGGRPSRRHALLEHVWLATLPAGYDWTLTVDASASAAGDDDDFVFTVSVDGTTWSPVLTVAAGTSGASTGPLPTGSAGSIRVRVVDTVRTRGATAPDTITLDRLVLTATGLAGGVGGTGDPGAELTLVVTGGKQQGRNVAELAWSGTAPVTVERDGEVLATDVAVPTWTDHTGTKGSASHTYRVCAGASCSASVTVTW